jgi:hypothetical protein
MFRVVVADATTSSLPDEDFPPQAQMTARIPIPPE